MTNAKAPAAHVLTHGLVDCAPWTSRYEGPYTRMAKLAILNVLSANDLCRALFGKSALQSWATPLHSRSLLAGVWLQKGSATRAFARPIADHAMDRLCGHWASWIASDERFRYCPRCLDMGFQSVVYQIEGIERCPLHDEPLLDSCIHCGAPTPAYAVTIEGFNRPMRCPRCANSYSVSWEGSCPVSRWTAPADERPIVAIYAWLKRLSTMGIEWPEFAMWKPDPSSDKPRKDLRTAAFDVFTSLLPLQVHGLRPSKVFVHVGRCSFQEGPSYCMDFSGETRQRLLIYKSIRRYIKRHLKPHRDVMRFESNDTIKIDWMCDSVLTTAKSVRPEVHGWLLWRYRFEQGFQPGSRFGAGDTRRPATPLKLRASVLGWPINWTVPAETWGHFALACFHEDVQAARRWQRALASLCEGSNKLNGAHYQQQEANGLFLEHFATWKHRLSPHYNPWPASIAQLVGRMEEREEPWLALVGSAERAV